MKSLQPVNFVELYIDVFRNEMIPKHKISLLVLFAEHMVTLTWWLWYCESPPGAVCAGSASSPRPPASSGPASAPLQPAHPRSGPPCSPPGGRISQACHVQYYEMKILLQLVF